MRKPEKDTSKWEMQEHRTGADVKTYMGAVGLSHHIVITDNSMLKTVVAVTGTKTSSETDWYDKALVPVTIEENDFINYTILASGILNVKISSNITSRSGFIGRHLEFDMLAKGNQTDTTGSLPVHIDNKGNSQYIQAFTQFKWQLPVYIALNAGIHYSYFLLNKNHTVEPRAGLVWQFLPSQKIGFAFGMHSKLEQLPVYFTQRSENGTVVYPNTDIIQTKALHYVLSYENRITDELHLKIEPYYQYLYDVPVSKQPQSTYATINGYDIHTVDTLVNEGSGRNYGIEITVEKMFAKSYYLLTTFSLYDSKYTTKEGIEFNTKYNGNYIGNVLGGKEFYIGKNNKNVLGLYGKIVYAGGKRYTPILLEESIAQGKTVEDETKKYSQKTKDYLRIDASLHYRINRKRCSHILALDIQNLTNRHNTLEVFYNSEKEKIDSIKMIGIIPALNYTIEF